MRRMKVLGWLLLLVIVAAGIGWWAVAVPYGPSSEVLVDIAPGTGTAQMAEQLKTSGIIRSALAFEVYKELKGGSLKAGVYQFDAPMTVAEVYAKIRRGDVFTKTVVIPEGYNIFDIAAAVQKAGLASSADFLKAAMTQTELVAQWNPHAVSLEGFLFPDTYKFSPHASPSDMVAAMVKRFKQEAGKIGLTAAQGADVYRDVTMASLVEREVHIAAERATVAGVFENRLAAGMPLQTDPSVVYGSMLAGTWTGVIHQSELHSESAYNTYTHTGLPPGPVCNPGVAALEAALNPAKTDYLYFVAKADGETTFAATLEQHNANVAAYRASMGLAPKLPGPPPPAEMRPQMPAMSAPKSRKHVVVRKPVHRKR